MTAPKMVEVTAAVPYSKFSLHGQRPAATDADSAAFEFAQFILDERWQEQTFRDRIQFDPVGVVLPARRRVGIYRHQHDQRQDLARTREKRDDGRDRAICPRGATAEEVERARNNLESQQLSSIEDLCSVSSTLNEIQQYYGGVEHFNDWAARYKQVTPDNVRKAVSRWLLTPNALTIKFTPITPPSDDTPEPDRTTPPPFQPENAVSSSGNQIRETPQRTPDLRQSSATTCRKYPLSCALIWVRRTPLPASPATASGDHADTRMRHAHPD